MTIISYISAFDNNAKKYAIATENDISFYQRTHKMICIEFSGKASIIDCIKIIEELKANNTHSITI